MKRDRFVVIFFVLVISYGMNAVNPQLKKVMTIGEEDRDDYLFFRIKDAVMSKKGDIYIADLKGAFISKFDKNGKFVKRVGQRGKGPKDFLHPRHLQLDGDMIFILDSLNYRIARCDHNLENFEYLRTDQLKHIDKSLNTKLFHIFRVLDEKLMLASVFRDKKGQDMSFIFNHDYEVKKMFFNHIPENLLKRNERIEIMSRCEIKIGVSKKHKRIMFAHRFANNPIDFHIYDYNGHLKKKFQHQLPAELKETTPFIYEDKYSKKRFNLFILTSIHAYRDYFIVFIEEGWNVCRHEDNDDKRVVPYGLIFDTNGNYKGKLPLEKTGEVFSISDDGHLLMQTIRDEDDETIKVTIYKITL